MKNPRHKQSGAQAVEFALVLPFLMLIIFAVIDFGLLVYNQAIITNASREGARQAVVLTASAWDPARVRQVACDYARSALITVSSGTRTATCTGTADPIIGVFSGPNASCPTPSGNASPAFGDPVATTITYTVSGFSMGTWYNLGVGANSVGSPLALRACTQMVHE